nr:hypothetical protein [Tanacetum cinerariifolium]
MLSPHNSDGSTDALTEEMGESSAKVTQISEVLAEQVHGGCRVWPIAIHGREKLDQLLRRRKLSKDEINDTCKIRWRIEAQELTLDASEVVITSTKQEIDEQWRLYNGFDCVLECKLWTRIRRDEEAYQLNLEQLQGIVFEFLCYPIQPEAIDRFLRKLNLSPCASLGDDDLGRQVKVKVRDVRAYGNCGFRAVAVDLKLHENEWPTVRYDLMKELRIYYDQYVVMFDTHKCDNVKSACSSSKIDVHHSKNR